MGSPKCWQYAYIIDVKKKSQKSFGLTMGCYKAKIVLIPLLYETGLFQGRKYIV